jgi:hypothetical protein
LKKLNILILVLIIELIGMSANKGPDLLSMRMTKQLAWSANVNFAIIGDYGLAGQPEQDVANLVKSWNPDFIFTVGDNNYALGASDTIDSNIGQYYHNFIYPYNGTYGAGASSNKFFPILGNHDWYTTNAQPYLDYFTLPGNERYYDQVFGPIHIFAIDSDENEPDGITANSTQAIWLQNALAGSSATWKIVLLHHAPYSSGAHGSTPTLRWPFKDWGADIVIAGHDHVYERLKVNQLTYLVNGAGGATLYGFGTPLSGSQVRFNSDYGAIYAQADANQITFKFITRQGNLIDSYQLQRANLVDSILPTSRSIPVGTKATVFATIINSGSQTARDVTLSMVSPPSGAFSYGQTDCATNQVVGAQDPILTIPGGGTVCYYIGFTPSASFNATNVHIQAESSNSPPSELFTGINTWTLRATNTPGPDMIALTTTTDFHQQSCRGTIPFAVALSNVGAVASLASVTANTGMANLALSFLIQETNPATGAIIGDNILENVLGGQNRTVVVWVTFNRCIPFDPAANRIFIHIRDGNNNLIGSTSVAVSTNR